MRSGFQIYLSHLRNHQENSANLADSEHSCARKFDSHDSKLNLNLWITCVLCTRVLPGSCLFPGRLRAGYASYMRDAIFHTSLLHVFKSSNGRSLLILAHMFNHKVTKVELCLWGNNGVIITCKKTQLNLTSAIVLFFLSSSVTTLSS